MEASSLVGYFAGFMGIIAFFPQVIKTWRTRSTRDISLWMFIIFCASNASWLLYGFLIDSWPLILTNAIVLTLASTVLFFKVRFG